MRQNAGMSETVRPPRQSRSRESWARVIDVATAQFEEGGYEALSISEVCRQAKVSAPSIYARVDGIDGLFRAVYERLIADIQATEHRELDLAEATVERVVAAAHRIFSRHEQALRAIIGRATADPELLAEGAQVSRELRDRIAALLPGDPGAASAAARTIYTECAFRVIYGAEFWREDSESGAAFEAHLTTVVKKILD